MIQFNPLHWGEILQTIILAGGDPASGGVAGVTSSATLTATTADATTVAIKGSGGVTARSGTSRRNGVGGSSQ